MEREGVGMGMGKGHPSITRRSVLASSSPLLQWESDGTLVLGVPELVTPELEGTKRG